MSYSFGLHTYRSERHYHIIGYVVSSFELHQPESFDLRILSSPPPQVNTYPDYDQHQNRHKNTDNSS